MNRQEEIIATLALQLTTGISTLRAKKLIEAFGSAQAVFTHTDEIMRLMPMISSEALQGLRSKEAFGRAESEYTFIESNQINCLLPGDEEFPSRLRECDDAPVALFFKGKTNLNALRVINMVGTRNASDYGKQLCSSFLQELAALCPEVLVVSGLAYGIDIHAHRAALANKLATVGVLAHGLDRIYPSTHRSTAVQMLENGGLLTEFVTGTQPERYNFVSRNRIVAGMADATIVVESASKGGSLITAEIADGYHRDCFAFPGRTTDAASIGCNQLIRDNKASLLLSAEDLVNTMRWNEKGSKKPKAIQRNLFPDLNEEEQQVVNILQKQGELQINTLVVEANIPIHPMSATLFELEMKGVIRMMAGGLYKLLD